MKNLVNSAKLLGVGLVCSLGTATLMYSQAHAQDGQPGMGGQGGMGGGMGMQMRGPQPMMMTPPSAMVVEGNSVFVLMGNTVYKLNGSDMHIAAHTELHGGRPMPNDQGKDRMPPMPGEGGRGGGG